tara:strand:+ start:170 stop:271 length:102 start_codon:yes stop_codon:yes gene_type:complete
MGVVYSTGIGNPWHGVKTDTRRKLNLKNKVKKK